MHGKAGMWQIIDTIEAKKIISIKQIATAPDTNVRIYKMQECGYYAGSKIQIKFILKS
jgi:hypothetical protein